MILQFFTQSNPLNNLNNITSSIPPLLQRQNSAPTTPQQQQQQPSQQSTDFFKNNNAPAGGPKSNVPAASSSAQPNVDIQRKYSLPMSTLSSAHSQQQQQAGIPHSMSQQLIRKQSAPTLPSIAPSNPPPPVPSHQNSHLSAKPQQQQLQRDISFQGSPARARDRNQFDRQVLNEDAQQLQLLKG